MEVVVALPFPRIRYGCAELLHKPYILIYAAFGHTDFFGKLMGGTRTLDTDQMIDVIQSLKDLLLHKIRF
jgi:hypothetical protein